MSACRCPDPMHVIKADDCPIHGQGDAADPSGGWPYPDRGPAYDSAEDPFLHGYEEAALADFTVGPREVLCSECHLVHPKNQECAW